MSPRSPLTVLGGIQRFIEDIKRLRMVLREVTTIYQSILLTKRRIIPLLLLIFIAALSIRIITVEVFGRFPEKDALEYHTIAINQLEGFGHALESGKPTKLRSPVYPLFLAGIYAVLGPDYRNALYVQAVSNVLLIFPLFWLGFRLSGEILVGVLATIFFAVHTSFEIVSRLYSENLVIIVALCFVFCIFYMIRRDSYYLAVLSGLLAGILGLIKPEYALIGFAMLFPGAIQPSLYRHRKQLAIVASVSLLIFGSWQLRNIALPDSDHSVYRHGQNTVIGAYYPALSGTWWWPITDMEELERARDEARAFIFSRPFEQSRQEIVAALIREPLGLVKLTLSRILILWASPPVGSSMIASVNQSLRWSAIVGQYLFVCCAFWMLIKVGREAPEVTGFVVMALYMTIFYGILHAIRRYGYPFVPELCLFAALFVWNYRLYGRKLLTVLPIKYFKCRQ